MELEVKQFTEAVGAIYPDVEHSMYVQFRQFFKRQSVFLLGGKFLIVKISRTEKPFWGIAKRYIDILNNYDDFHLVLLTSYNDGYCFSKNEINKSIENKKWGLSKDQYKINPPLPDQNSFCSIESFKKQTE